jgi:signal peptidase II
MSKFRDYITLLGIAGLVVALDQWTKYLVRVSLAVGEQWNPIDSLAPYVRIINWNNTGAAFGMLPSAGIFFTVVAILVSIAIIYYFPRVPREEHLLRLALALQLGGALGNLIDRLLQGPVTDFISVARFPVFNVADASISLGVLLMIVAMIQDSRKRQAQAEEQDDSLNEQNEAESEVERTFG